MYLEYIYGRSFTRWKDFENNWNLSEAYLRGVIRRKITMVLQRMRIWPRFATIEGYAKLRQKHWNQMIEGDLLFRLIMHDMTNVPLDQPSDSETNRVTYSKYYNGNCGKGSIFTQLCGWDGTLELYTGGIGDSDYVRK